MTLNLTLLLEFGFLLAMLFAAVRDLAAWSLPNWLTIAVALGYFAWALAGGAGWTAVGWSVAAGVLVLGCGYLLFTVNLWGAGDGKLAAAVALWIGLNFELFRFFLIVSLAGGVLAVAALLIHAATGKPQLPPGDPNAETARRNPLKAKARYGAAIAIGALYFWLRHTQAACFFIDLMGSASPDFLSEIRACPKG
jgi:prepilin peptidase CpaA